MADDDLIRRGDALKCCQTQRRGSAVAYDIAALPAQGVDARRLIQTRIDTIIREEGSHEWDTGVTNLPEWAQTAVEELEAILAALEPAEAGGVEFDWGQDVGREVLPSPVDAGGVEAMAIGGMDPAVLAELPEVRELLERVDEAVEALDYSANEIDNLENVLSDYRGNGLTARIAAERLRAILAAIREGRNG